MFELMQLGLLQRGPLIMAPYCTLGKCQKLEVKLKVTSKQDVAAQPGMHR